MSDNFHFDITGASMKKCLDIAFTYHSKAIGWAERKLKNGKALVLYWSDSNVTGINKFPSPLTAEQVEPMILQWLKDADYGNQPDHDGDNDKGWRVFNEAWGHINSEWQSFVAIQPIWLMYGK